MKEIFQNIGKLCDHINVTKLFNSVFVIGVGGSHTGNFGHYDEVKTV